MNAKNFPIKCDHHYVISLVTAIEWHRIQTSYLFIYLFI
jgi:hypothetical protein